MLFIVEYKIPTDRSVRWQHVEAETEAVARGIVNAMYPLSRVESVVRMDGWIREK